MAATLSAFCADGVPEILDLRHGQETFFKLQLEARFSKLAKDSAQVADSAL